MILLSAMIRKLNKLPKGKTEFDSPREVGSDV